MPQSRAYQSYCHTHENQHGVAYGVGYGVAQGRHVGVDGILYRAEGGCGGACPGTASQVDGRMEFEYPVAHPHAYDKGQCGGEHAGEEEHEAHLLYAGDEGWSCRYAYYGYEHVQAKVVEQPYRGIGDAAESRVLSPQPAQHKACDECATGGGQAHRDASQMD